MSLYGDSGAKQCSQCNQILSWDKFSYRIQSGQRYLRSKCKDCTLTAWTEWAALHPEHKNAKRVSDQKCHQNYKKFHRRGITRDQYLIMLEQQCGCCAICKKPPKDGNDLAIDHNHKTNAVRGLLCKECNRGLGLFGDNIKTVQNALQYLQQRGSYG